MKYPSARPSAGIAWSKPMLVLAMVVGPIPIALLTEGCKKGEETGDPSTSTTTTTTTTTTVTTSTTTTTGTGGAPPGDCEVIDQGDPILDGFGDFVDSVESNTPTYTCDCIDIAESSATRTSCSATAVDTAYNASGAAYGCTGSPDVVCPNDSLPMPAGEVLEFRTMYVTPVPLADAGHSFIYSLVMDSDGVAANDWVFVPPYNWDLFQGADRWYELVWSHTSQTWTARVTQVDDQQQTSNVPSAARAVIAGNQITWHIPASEIPATNATYRATAFGHDGSFSPTDRGADVDGANPTVPLTPVP